MGHSYKQLASSDISLLKELLSVFAQAFEDQDSYQSAIPNDDYLSALLNKPHFIALVAMDADRIVGGLTAYVLDKFEQDRREIYIYDLAVLQTHRRKGIAISLIRQLQEIAAEREAYVIFVQADREDAPAIALYESLGTREDVHHFDLPVNLSSKK